jgi:hypothetical protein
MEKNYLATIKNKFFIGKTLQKQLIPILVTRPYLRVISQGKHNESG